MDMTNNLQAIAHKDNIVYYTVLSDQRYPLSRKISGQTLTNNIYRISASSLYVLLVRFYITDDAINT
jgi:hypothetical protein